MPPRRRSTAGEDDIALARLPQAPPLPPADEPAPLPFVPMVTASDVRAERELDDILQEIGGGDIKVKVSRFADSGAMQACGEMPGDTFSMETLTDTFGGGRYLLRFMRGRQEVDKTRVEVDALIPPRNPRAPRAVASAAPQGDSMAMMTSVVGMMATMMTTSMQATQTMMAGMAEMMKARPPEKDPMDAALRIAEVVRSGSTQNPADLFAIFEKGLNVARRLEGGGDDGVMPLVSEGVKGVVALMEGIGAEKRAAAGAIEARRIAPPVTVAGAPPVAPPVAVIERPAPSESMPASVPSVALSLGRPWLDAVAPFAPQLAQAIGLFSPDTVASAVLDRLTDEQLDDLVLDIEDVAPPMFARRTLAALGVEPDAAKVEWLSRVAGIVLASVEAEHGEAVETDAPNTSTETGADA